MDIGNIINQKGSAAAVAQLRQQLEQAVQMNSRTTSDLGSTKSSNPGQKPIHQASGLPNMPYPSALEAQPLPMVSSGFLSNNLQQNGYTEPKDLGSGRGNSDNASKQFACSTCQKRFARRSDLARHGKRSPPCLPVGY